MQHRQPNIGYWICMQRIARGERAIQRLRFRILDAEEAGRDTKPSRHALRQVERIVADYHELRENLIIEMEKGPAKSH